MVSDSFGASCMNNSMCFQEIHSNLRLLDTVQDLSPFPDVFALQGHIASAGCAFPMHAAPLQTPTMLGHSLVCRNFPTMHQKVESAQSIRQLVWNPLHRLQAPAVVIVGFTTQCYLDRKRSCLPCRFALVSAPTCSSYSVRARR